MASEPSDSVAVSVPTVEESVPIASAAAVVDEAAAAPTVAQAYSTAQLLEDAANTAIADMATSGSAEASLEVSTDVSLEESAAAEAVAPVPLVASEATSRPQTANAAPAVAEKAAVEITDVTSGGLDDDDDDVHLHAQPESSRAEESNSIPVLALWSDDGVSPSLPPAVASEDPAEAAATPPAHVEWITSSHTAADMKQKLSIVFNVIASEMQLRVDGRW